MFELEVYRFGVLVATLQMGCDEEKFAVEYMGPHLLASYPSATHGYLIERAPNPLVTARTVCRLEGAYR